jgi:hypothetical protein
MGRSGLSKEVVDQVKKRRGAAGEKTDVGITVKEGTKDEKRTEDEGGFWVLFSVLCVEGVSKRKVVHKK